MASKLQWGVDVGQPAYPGGHAGDCSNSHNWTPESAVQNFTFRAEFIAFCRFGGALCGARVGGDL